MIGLGAGLCGVLIVIIGLIICICVKNRNQEKAVTPLNVVSKMLLKNQKSVKYHLAVKCPSMLFQ